MDQECVFTSIYILRITITSVTWKLIPINSNRAARLSSQQNLYFHPAIHLSLYTTVHLTHHNFSSLWLYNPYNHIMLYRCHAVHHMDDYDNLNLQRTQYTAVQPNQMRHQKMPAVQYLYRNCTEKRNKLTSLEIMTLLRSAARLRRFCQFDQKLQS
jgi:hypothetical protein